MIKLLLVEDDANLCYIIRGGLEDMIGGYEVMTACLLYTSPSPRD